MRPNHHFETMSFRALRNQIKDRFIKEARPVHTGTWQGVDISERPEAVMYELLNVTATVPLDRHADEDAFRRDIAPNLPWADDHFRERIGGTPINPGIEWANWPWGDSAEKALNEHGMFNHNYMERLWPKFAGHAPRPTTTWTDFIDAIHELPGKGKDIKPHRGIRWEYGDLLSLCDLIRRDPYTRQAWIPLFFPEDTGIGDGGRKPCTLGYQFILRDNRVHVYYPLRSCDFAHHMQDDIYLAVRLLMWVKNQGSVEWQDAQLGSYSMHCTSLHVFTNDFIAMGGIPR